MLYGAATPSHGTQAESWVYRVLPRRTAISCTAQTPTGHVLSVCTVDWAPDQSSLSSFLGRVHQLSSLLAIGTVCRRACHRAQALSRAGVMTSVPLACWHARAHPKHQKPQPNRGQQRISEENGLTERTRLNKARFALEWTADTPNTNLHVYTPVEQGRESQKKKVVQPKTSPLILASLDMMIDCTIVGRSCKAGRVENWKTLAARACGFKQPESKRVENRARTWKS